MKEKMDHKFTIQSCICTNIGPQLFIWRMQGVQIIFKNLNDEKRKEERKFCPFSGQVSVQWAPWHTFTFQLHLSPFLRIIHSAKNNNHKNHKSQWPSSVLLFYTWENWGPKKLSTLSEVIQYESGRIWVRKSNIP